VQARASASPLHELGFFAEKNFQLVLEVREGVEIVEENRRHPLNSRLVAAQLKATIQSCMHAPRPSDDAVEFVEQPDFIAHDCHRSGAGGKGTPSTPHRLAKNAHIFG
jgi:hypothetical protein